MTISWSSLNIPYVKASTSIITCLQMPGVSEEACLTPLAGGPGAVPSSPSWQLLPYQGPRRAGEAGACFHSVWVARRSVWLGLARENAGKFPERLPGGVSHLMARRQVRELLFHFCFPALGLTWDTATRKYDIQRWGRPLAVIQGWLRESQRSSYFRRSPWCCGVIWLGTSHLQTS